MPVVVLPSASVQRASPIKSKRSGTSRYAHAPIALYCLHEQTHCLLSQPLPPP